MSETRLVPVGPGPLEEPGDEREMAAVTIDGPAGTGDDGRGATVADLEALLFVAERPLTRAELRSLTGLGADDVDARLGDLEVQLRDRGIRLVTSGEQVMLGTSPESGPLIARYLGADAVRLSPAALETLAIVAYRQPVTRGTIERIRGVDSGHVVRSLLHRRLIRELGRADSPGRPILYVTSIEFMERFGLTSLDDLPPIEAEVAARLAEADVDDAVGVTDADDAMSTHEPGVDLEGSSWTTMAEPVRIQKALAEAGVASRRAADALVVEGRVSVNGEPATTGQRVDPSVDVLAVDGRPILPAGRRTYLVMHKPAGVTSSVRDRHAERTVLDLLPPDVRLPGSRLYPVGRLDKDSEGLLLLTDDGDWTQRLLHPRYGVEREYAIGLREPLTGDQARELHDGIELDEGVARLVRLRPETRTETSRRVAQAGPALTWYRAVLRQGWRRQLRRMFAGVGAPVARLVRVRIGTLRLDDLAPGAVRSLSAAERERLASTRASR